MTDSALVAKKLALIETYLRELRELGRPDQIERDVRERRFVEHTLQLAIQAALDVASHIASDNRLGEPRTHHELFTLLERFGWIAPDVSVNLRKMAGFRNILVHGYDKVCPDVVRDVVLSHLGDLDAFVAAVRAALAKKTP